MRVDMLDVKIFIAASCFALSILLLSGSPSAYAVDKKDGILVWRIQAKSGVSEDDAVSISGFITTEVQRYSKRYVVSEADIRTVLEGEEKRQKCDLGASSCLVEIGSALGVPEAVSGDLGRLGDFWMLNLRRLNVRKAEVIMRSSRQVEGSINELIKSIPGAVAELFEENLEAMAKPKEKGTLSIKTDPSGAGLSLDGKNIGPSPFRKVVAAGKYKVSASLEKHEDASWAGEVKANETTEVSLELEKIAPPMNAYKLWGHVTFWSGLGLAAFGGLATAMAGVEGDKYDNAKSLGEENDAKAASRAWAGTAIAGYSLGGALMATGVVLWLIDPNGEPPEKDTSIGAAPTVDGRGFAVSVCGRW